MHRSSLAPHEPLLRFAPPPAAPGRRDPAPSMGVRLCCTPPPRRWRSPPRSTSRVHLSSDCAPIMTKPSGASHVPGSAVMLHRNTMTWACARQCARYPEVVAPVGASVTEVPPYQAGWAQAQQKGFPRWDDGTRPYYVGSTVIRLRKGHPVPP